MRRGARVMKRTTSVRWRDRLGTGLGSKTTGYLRGTRHTLVREGDTLKRRI